MPKHHTQQSRKEQIDRTEQLIIKAGGWANICKENNERWFTYVLARELDCNFSRAKEYIELVVNSSIGISRLGWKKE